MNLADLKLADRESYLRSQGFFKDCPKPKYAIVWEDPTKLDSACAITTPSPQWLKMALRGGVLPPIEAYLRDKNVPDNEPKEHPYATPIGPMTEEEAMEYLLKKDVPPYVWRSDKGNRPRFAIVKQTMLPTNREHRNAWRLAS